MKDDVKKVLDTISQCVVCGKPVQLRPWDTTDVPQWSMRCPRHHKELLKIWPAKFKEYWELARGEQSG